MRTSALFPTEAQRGHIVILFYFSLFVFFGNFLEFLNPRVDSSG